MSKVLIEEQTLYDIGDAIREKRYTSTTYKPGEMASEIRLFHGDVAAFDTLFGLNTSGFYSLTIPGVIDTAIGVFTNFSYFRSQSINLTLPDTITIGASSFQNCELTNVSAPKCYSVYAWAFIGCAHLETAYFPECVHIYTQAFTNCNSLTNASFPKCTIVGSSAFHNCSSLTTASFPECSTVRQHAFHNCISLTTANFPECTILESEAFANCYALTSASFPLISTAISNHAFYNCSSLLTAYFPDAIRVGFQAFSGCTSLSVASFPKCMVVDAGAFTNCNSLTNVSFPECVSIGSRAFYLGDSFTDADRTNYTLSYLYFPKVTDVDSSDVFNRLAALKSIRFDAIQHINDPDFLYGCSTLESVYILASAVCSLNYTSFVLQGTPLDSTSFLGYFGSIFVPESLVSSYKAASGWSNFADRITAYVGE